MKITWLVACCLLVLLACKDSPIKQEDKKYEEAKQSLAEAEKSYPLTFLKIEGTFKRNFIGQSVVKAIVTNYATVVKYKNIRVKALYYKGVEVVTNHEDVITDVIAPGATYNFKSKYFTPKGTDKITFSIMSAEVAE